MTEEEKDKRLKELQERAVDRYLDDSDFDCTEWMDGEEKKEYAKLYKEVNGFCALCGEENENCECEKKGGI